MAERASDNAMDGLLFVLVPLGAIAQSVTPAQLLGGQQAPWTFKVAVVFAASTFWRSPASWCSPSSSGTWTCTDRFHDVPAQEMQKDPDC